MRSPSRMAGVLVTAGLLAPVVLAGAPAYADAKPHDKAGSAASVTLITGDKVVVVGPDRAMIEPGPGRRHIKFAVARSSSVGSPPPGPTGTCGCCPATSFH